MPDPTPEAMGRMHALHRLAELAADQAERRPDQPDIPDEARRYLTAFRETCQSIADRLRRSPGWEG